MLQVSWSIALKTCHFHAQTEFCICLKHSKLLENYGKQKDTHFFLYVFDIIIEYFSSIIKNDKFILLVYGECHTR